MRVLPLALIAATLLVTPAFAQSTQGRWECHGAAPADPSQPAAHGLLTLFGQSYSYSSATYGDPLSGSGTVEQQESGIAFDDGALAQKGGIETGQIDTGSGALAMDLNGKDNTVVLTCLAM